MTRVGITGHQHLDDPARWSWVEHSLRAELTRLEAPLVGVGSLAVGTDQMFARLVLERGGRLVAVLPFRDIERTFSPEAIPGYRELVARAVVEVLDTAGSDEDAYLAAGQRVVDSSELLLAVWNGKAQASRGGSADIVAYATGRRLPVIHIDPSSATIRRLGKGNAE